VLPYQKKSRQTADLGGEVYIGGGSVFWKKGRKIYLTPPKFLGGEVHTSSRKNGVLWSHMKKERLLVAALLRKESGRYKSVTVLFPRKKKRWTLWGGGRGRSRAFKKGEKNLNKKGGEGRRFSVRNRKRGGVQPTHKENLKEKRFII